MSVSKPRCSKCGRPLSDPLSVALGMGPECRGTRGLAKHLGLKLKRLGGGHAEAAEQRERIQVLMPIHEADVLPHVVRAGKVVWRLQADGTYCDEAGRTTTLEKLRDWAKWAKVELRYG